MPPNRSGVPSWARPHQVEEQTSEAVSTDPEGWPPRGTPTGIMLPTSEFLARSRLTSNLWLSGPTRPPPPQTRPGKESAQSRALRAKHSHRGTPRTPRGQSMPQGNPCQWVPRGTGFPH